MSFELNTEPEPPDREERFGALFAILGSLLFFGGGGALIWLILR